MADMLFADQYDPTNGCTGHGSSGGGTSESDCAGAAYIIHGPVSGNLDMVLDSIHLLGEQPGDQAGTAISSAGDVNGDGIGEIAVGAEMFQTDDCTECGGRVYIVEGPILSDTPLAAAETIVYSDTLDDWIGGKIAGVGDFNGDGYDDVMHSGTGPFVTAEAFVVFGPAGGYIPAQSADLILLPDVSSEGSMWVAGPGDIDGNGTADLLLSCVGCAAENSDWSRGLAWLVLGPHTGTFCLDNADVRMEGEEAGDQAGYQIAGVGDTDGDGTPDIAIGAQYADIGATNGGAIYLLSGASLADL